MSDEKKLERSFNALESFGTDIESARLSPNAVLQAAREDFKRLERNQHQQKMIKDRQIITPDYEHFAFHRKHVHKAKNEAELLGLAMRFQSIGTESGKRNTRLIYRDMPVLEAAFKLAGGILGEEHKIDNPGPKEMS